VTPVSVQLSPKMEHIYEVPEHAEAVLILSLDEKKLSKEMAAELTTFREHYKFVQRRMREDIAPVKKPRKRR